MITGWIEILRRPFHRSGEFLSVDARRMSDPRNYELLTSPPQKFHMSKGPDGLVTTATTQTPETPVVRNFSPPPPEFTRTSRAERSASLNFSHPRPPLERTASRNNRITFSLEGPTTSPIIEWQSSSSEQTALPSNSDLPSIQQRSIYERPSQTRANSALGRERERTSSASGKDWSAIGPTSASRGSPLPHRSYSALSNRDWDPTSTFAPGEYRKGALSPSRSLGNGSWN